jgi:hypothetical protein
VPVEPRGRPARARPIPLRACECHRPLSGQRRPADCGPCSSPIIWGLCEHRETGLSFRIVAAPIPEHAHAPHRLVLLRPCGERP